MTKPKQSAPINEATIDAVFQIIENLLADVPDGDRDLFAKILRRTKAKVLGVECTRAATDFTLDDVVYTFKLKYSREVSFNSLPESHWKIEDELKSPFPRTPCFESLISNYSKNFGQSSGGVCRTALDFILNECLTVMKNNHRVSEAPDREVKTPMPWQNIQVYGEVSFTHSVPLGPTTVSSTSSYKRLTVTGRLDYSIGRMLGGTAVNDQKRRVRRFQSLLIIVEAKAHRAVDQAAKQLLLTYLACLRQSRVRGRRTDTSVYGVASDGYFMEFVMITHDGRVKISRRFDVCAGDILKILGCLRHILEITASMTPNSTSEKGKDAGVAGDYADYGMDVDDNQYKKQAQTDEDEDDAL